MIAFRCSGCGLHMQVQDQFAGQRARCPACKHIEVAPYPATVAWQPPRHIDGVASSLTRAGLDGGGVTLGLLQPSATIAGATRQPLTALLKEGASLGQRYLLEQEVGRGGMGAVLRAVD